MTQPGTSSGLVVIQPVKDWACAECGGTGDLLRMDDAGPLCLPCADLGHLVFLPAGDAALTRRATKASSLSAVVVRWSRTRKRYERQGVLVEEQGLTAAEEQCLTDQDARMRRRERDRVRRAGADERFQAHLAHEITRLFPGCPPERATAIARHTGARGTGRVGRSAAGRALDEDAITLAVIASIRHEETRYDTLLMSGLPRNAARDQVRPTIDRVLATWRRQLQNTRSALLGILIPECSFRFGWRSWWPQDRALASSGDVRRAGGGDRRGRAVAGDRRGRAVAVALSQSLVIPVLTTVQHGAGGLCAPKRLRAPQLPSHR